MKSEILGIVTGAECDESVEDLHRATRYFVNLKFYPHDDLGTSETVNRVPISLEFVKNVKMAMPIKLTIETIY